MSLTVLGTAANVFGVITPAKDFGEIIKGIADLVQEVKTNDESISYWDNTLQEHAKEVYSFMMQCGVAGANELQIRSLQRLFISLNLLRKEIIENSRRSYLTKLLTSGDIQRKIERLERKIKHCQDLFLTDAQIIQVDMLSQINRGVTEIANRDGRSYTVECTVIRWKKPGKADSNDPLTLEYAYLAKKSHTLIYELKSNAVYIQEQLLKSDHNIEISRFARLYYPGGNPQSECEDASSRTIRSIQMLRSRNFDDTSFIKWVIDSEKLSCSLYKVGLRKEALQIREFTCQMWTALASRRGTATIFSRLACSLSDLALEYSNEGRSAEALSHIEQAIQIYRSFGEFSLPQLAKCLSRRSHYLRFPGCFEGSLESAQESVGMWRRLIDENLSLYGPDLVYSLKCQADALRSLSRHEEALRCSQEALQWLSKLSPHYKQVHSYLYAWVSWALAQSHRKLGDLEQAREYGRRALSVYYVLIRNRPLYYSNNLSSTISYSSWFDHKSALTVLDESLTVCLAVDTTFTASQLANVLDRRAAALVSNSRYAEALDSYNQAIDVRRRLLEDEDDDSKHFKALLKVFRLRASCLLSLHQQRDALSSLEAAQDAIVSRLESKIDESTSIFVIQELEEKRKLLKVCTGPDCIELISSLKSCEKVLSAIHELKHGSRIGYTARSDFGIVSTMEYEIYLILRKEDLALLSIQDAIDFYRSEIEQNEGQQNRANLVASLLFQARSCIKMDHLEQAMCSFSDAVDHLRTISDKVKCDSIYYFKIYDLYSGIFNRLIHEKDCRQNLRLFLESAIIILHSPIMTSHYRTRRMLARMLHRKAKLLYYLGSYEDAISASEESVHIYRRLVTEDVGLHQRDLASSLYRLAKLFLANGNGDAALSSVEEAIEIDQRIEDRDSNGAYDLMLSLSLRAEILYRTGGAADVRDSLSEMWPLQIPNPLKSEHAQS